MNINKIFKEWGWTILILIGIIGIAFFIRIYNLTLLPVFVDEAIYIRWSQIMEAEATLRFLPLSDGKQPLFMWILMFLVKRFSDPLFIGRFLSVICGIGTLFGVFALSYLLFKNKVTSLVSTIIYTLSPFPLFFDRMALVDSMLNLFGVWTVFFAVLVAKTRRLDLAMITGFFLGFMLLTKSPAIFFVILLPFTWLLADKKFLMKLIVLYGVTLLIAYGMYNILRLGPNFHLVGMRNQDYVYPYSHILTDPFNPFKGHMGGIKSYFILLGPLSLVPLIILGIFVNFKKNLYPILTTLAFAVAPILVIAEYSKVVTARYVLFVFPFFIILAASSFVSKIKWFKYTSMFFLILFVIQSVLFDYKLLTNVESAPLPYGDRSGYLEEWTAGQGIREIAGYLKSQISNLKSGEKMVVGTEGYFGTLPDGLQMYLNDNSQIIVIGVGLNLTELPKSLVESKKSGNKTYLVVNKSRLAGDPEKLGLKLISSYPKALRRVGSNEYKAYGPQEVLYFFEVK